MRDICGEPGSRIAARWDLIEERVEFRVKIGAETPGNALAVVKPRRADHSDAGAFSSCFRMFSGGFGCCIWCFAGVDLFSSRQHRDFKNQIPNADADAENT